MGVPTVALEGECELARSTPGLLRILGLSEFIGSDIAEYRIAATRTASDFAKLADHRRHLRQRFRESPLADARSVVRAVENAYRTMWQRYCTVTTPSA
jgi:predicted O-linked N-acetylglucosamine transferase (SPINDLY family)